MVLYHLPIEPGLFLSISKYYGPSISAEIHNAGYTSSNLHRTDSSAYFYTRIKFGSAFQSKAPPSLAPKCLRVQFQVATVKR